MTESNRKQNIYKIYTRTALALDCARAAFFVILVSEKEAIFWLSRNISNQIETYIETNIDSEFLKAVDGRKADKVWKLIDELVEAVKILHPRMHTTFIDKVQDL